MCPWCELVVGGGAGQNSYLLPPSSDLAPTDEEPRVRHHHLPPLNGIRSGTAAGQPVCGGSMAMLAPTWRSSPFAVDVASGRRSHSLEQLHVRNDDLRTASSNSLSGFGARRRLQPTLNVDDGAGMQVVDDQVGRAGGRLGSRPRSGVERRPRRPPRDRRATRPANLAAACPVGV